MSQRNMREMQPSSAARQCEDCRKKVEERMKSLEEYACISPLNKVEYNKDTKIGIITREYLTSMQEKYSETMLHI